jgi:hypothetical protein
VKRSEKNKIKKWIQGVRKKCTKVGRNSMLLGPKGIDCRLVKKFCNLTLHKGSLLYPRKLWFEFYLAPRTVWPWIWNLSDPPKQLYTYLHSLTSHQVAAPLFQDRRLPPRLNWILPSSGLIRGVRWFETDVSVLPIDRIYNGQADQE